MSNLPRAARRQAKLANDLIAQLNAPPGGNPDPNAPPPIDVLAHAQPIDGNQPPGEPPAQDPPADPAQPVQDPPADPAQPAPPAQDTFEQKYNVLQGKYNTEMAALRRQVAESDERASRLEVLLSQLNQRMGAPAAQPAAASAAPAATKLLTDAEIKDYGADFVDVVGRRAREVLEPIIAQEVERRVGPLKQSVQQRLEADAVSARQRVYDALAKAVPNWQEVNISPAFLAWLGNVDVFSNRSRRDLLTEAMNANDGTRVSAIFSAFVKEDSTVDPASQPQPRVAAVSRETLVAPGAPRSGPVGAPGGSKRVITQQEITEFYDRVRRGKVSPEDKKSFETDLHAAVRENRVQ